MPTKITADNIILTTLETSVISIPKVSSIVYGDDDQATSIDGGQTVGLHGSGFVSNCQILIDGVYANSVTFVSSTVISFITPARSAGTYPLYVVNPDGGTAIVIPGISYGGTPSFTTGAGSVGSEYETLSFSSNIVATSDSAVTYAVSSGSLPGGLSLNANTGVISGTLASVAAQTTYNFTIKASDAELQDTSRTFNITVLPDVVTWNSPNNNTVITQYETLGVTQSLNATSYLGKSITYTANVLPGNLSISANTITGNLAAGAANTVSLITATSADTSKTATRTLQFTVNPDVVTWSSPADGFTISQYEYTSVTQALNASSLLGFSASYSANSLPSGITISGSNITGTLPGTATVANSTSIITATSATTNRTATRTINFSINPDVVTWSSPSAGQSYSYTEGNSVNIPLSAASAAGQNISYSASGLPSGLSISGAAITGTLTTFGSFSVTLTATAANTGKTANRSISFTVASAAVDVVYTTAGTYSWTVPAGVTSICAVTVGGAGSGSNSNGNAGGGGALAYVNAISVTPGETLTVVVGNRGTPNGSTRALRTGANSSVSRGATVLVAARGGGGSFGPSSDIMEPGAGTNGNSAGGTVIVGTGGSGGQGSEGNTNYAGGGGGAAGYSGNGGNGVYVSTSAILVGGTGSGGGGGGGGGTNNSGGGGGGVGLYGQGANGIGGSSLRPGTASDPGANARGRGGSGGTDGGGQTNGGVGGVYGGGGGGKIGGTVQGGGVGAVRILWRAGAAFPSTNVGA